MSGKIDDLRDERVPDALYWSVEEVAKWVEEIGFPFYMDCFESNFINGRRLMLIDASAMPRIGITDFEHIKVLSKSIREILKVEDPIWNKSISLPQREQLGQYLERKITTGESADTLTYEKFLHDSEELKWQPPLANLCLIMPHE